MEVKQGMNLGVNDEDDVTTAPPVSTVWPTEWLKLLAVDGGTTVSAVAGGNM